LKLLQRLAGHDKVQIRFTEPGARSLMGKGTKSMVDYGIQSVADEKVDVMPACFDNSVLAFSRKNTIIDMAKHIKNTLRCLILG
jgi:hypothetical protein